MYYINVEYFYKDKNIKKKKFETFNIYIFFKKKILTHCIRLRKVNE